MSLTATGLDASVVIGFKDWGLDRLDLSIRALREALGGLQGEVIVADYGSSDSASNRKVVESAGGKYLYIETNGVWSRSRALNAGIAISTGSVVITTDADMLFSPGSLERVVDQIIDDPNQAIVLQCRDLPAEFDSTGVRTAGLQWEEFERVSRFRPRWGMGGMMAVHRDAFMAIRGFDERMEVYGGEDMDFAARIQRSGRRLRWIEDDAVRMYHMWHPSSRAVTEQSISQKASVKKNSQIVSHDKSYIRNVEHWQYRPHDAQILVTVVICTRNRSSYLSDSIYSVLGQTTDDFEIIVVDDGSDDDTREIVAGIGDPRIRYYYQEKKGLAVGRNAATHMARGRFIVIHDDDDIMLPDRIARHFEALEGGMQGTYGGWIDFRDGDAKDFKANPGKPFKDDIVRFVGEVFVHATLMLPTSLMKQVPYDETLRSGSDYSLAVRLSRSGIKLKHFGHYAILRRLHHHQVTHADSGFQRSSWAFTKSLGMHNLSPSQVKFMQSSVDQKFVDVMPKAKVPSFMNVALPDSMATRYAIIPLIAGASIDRELTESPRSRISVIFDELENPIGLTGAIEDVTLRELYLLRKAGIPFDVKTIPWTGRVLENLPSIDDLVLSKFRNEVISSDSIIVMAESDHSPDDTYNAKIQSLRHYRVERSGQTRWIYVFAFKNYSSAASAALEFSIKYTSDISLVSQTSIVQRLGSAPSSAF